VAGLAVAGLAIALLVANTPATGPTSDLRSPGYELPAAVEVEGRAIGRADAPLTLQVYSDFQCPICRRFATDYLPRLVEEFVVPGRLRIVDEPIAILGTGVPDESLDSAVGAVCAAEQDAYWSFHDWLFANQQGENRGAFSRTRLASIAGDVVADPDAWAACVDDPSRSTAVTARTQSVLSAGISSTPTFRLGDRLMTGLPRSYDDFRAVVEEALALVPSA
jgi:protein-disulfide isomerase